MTMTEQDGSWSPRVQKVENKSRDWLRSVRRVTVRVIYFGLSRRHPKISQGCLKEVMPSDCHVWCTKQVLLLFLTAKAPFTGVGLHGCGALLWVSTSGIEVLEPRHVWTCHSSLFKSIMIMKDFKFQCAVYSYAESKTVATFRRAKKGHGRTVLGDVGSQDRHAAANSRFATRESRFKCFGAMAWQRQRWHDAMMVRIISWRHSEFLHFEVSSCFYTLFCLHHVFLFHWIGWEFYNYNLPP